MQPSQPTTESGSIRIRSRLRQLAARVLASLRTAPLKEPPGQPQKAGASLGGAARRVGGDVEDPPNAADFKRWANILAERLTEAGRLRSYLKVIANKTWDLTVATAQEQRHSCRRGHRDRGDRSGYRDLRQAHPPLRVGEPKRRPRCESYWVRENFESDDDQMGSRESEVCASAGGSQSRAQCSGRCLRCCLAEFVDFGAASEQGDAHAQHENEESDEADAGDIGDYRRCRAEQPQPSGERPHEQAKPSDPSRQCPRSKDGPRVQRNDHAKVEEIARSIDHKGGGCEGV